MLGNMVREWLLTCMQVCPLLWCAGLWLGSRVRDAWDGLLWLECPFVELELHLPDIILHCWKEEAVPLESIPKSTA